MTPSIERGGIHKKQGSQSINQDRQSYMKGKQADRENEMNYSQVLNNTKQVMVTDGGTGASLKRVFIQADSSQTSNVDSQSNYGSSAHHHA